MNKFFTCRKTLFMLFVSTHPSPTTYTNLLCRCLHGFLFQRILKWLKPLSSMYRISASNPPSLLKEYNLSLILKHTTIQCVSSILVIFSSSSENKKLEKIGIVIRHNTAEVWNFLLVNSFLPYSLPGTFFIRCWK